MSPDTSAQVLGAAVPSRGNRASKLLARLGLRLWRWRVLGVFPNVPKAVLVVAPHTSNWDFLAGVLAMFALGLQVCWLGKHTLFRWPLRPVLRWLGGIPVRRDSRSGTVATMVETMRQRERMLVAIAPEGTRKTVRVWRMGFAHLAVGAGVPLVPIVLDRERRELRLGAALMLAGDPDADAARLREAFGDAFLPASA